MTHPDFVEEVRGRLVVPRRNVARALWLLPKSKKNAESEQSLLALAEELDELAQLVDEELATHVHTCRCGHVHYVQGDSV